MSDETILLPCPFCGCDPWEPFSTKWTNCIGDMSWSASVHCPECEITVKTECVYETAEAAIEAAARKWNTRAPVEYEGWFYLPKPKNSLVRYGTPQIEKMENGYKAKQPIEVIDSAIRAWGDELGEHIMKRICEVWNTRTHGTLTVEQVEKAISDCSTYASYDGCTYYASGIRLQAIADELNETVGNGTCENANKDGYGFRFDCAECGYSTIVLNCATRLDELPNFCPKCGRWVKR